jgi:hypothetical protein
MSARDGAFGRCRQPGLYDAAMSTSIKAPLGSSAPDFTLPRSGGGTVRLSDYRGRPVVLAFLRGYA